ncbi:MAG: hypothetical protein FJW85_13700, partial [Actinobacteria bacterium]|nr:hypothetical protein [Actinomycetota bacterium]
MKMRTLWLSVGVALITALTMGQGCAAGRGNELTGSGSTGSASGPSGSGGDCLLCGTGGGGGDDQQGVIVISPATAALAVGNGNVPTQQFSATINGTDVTSAVTWVVEKPDTGSISKGGLLTPTGKVGGVTKILALYNQTKGEALATISVSLVANTANLSSSDQQLLDAAQPTNDPGFRVTYPLDGVVVPLRMLSPEIMWNSAKSATAYRLRLTSKYIDYIEYFTSQNPGIKALSQQQWEDIQFSGTGPVSDPLKVELARLSGGVAEATTPISIGIAQGIVYGSVYYWQLPYQGGSNGKILRIKPSSEIADEFFPSSDCWGCHSVSRDGTKMMATFELGGFNGFPQQLIDLSKMPAQLGTIQAGTGITGVFSTFNNDGTKVAYSNNFGGGMGANVSAVHIVDAVTGQQVLQNALPPGCGEPSWSPDGTMLAGICGMDGGGWTFDSFSGDLTIAHLNAQQNQVTSMTTVVPQGNLTGRPAYP